MPVGQTVLLEFVWHDCECGNCEEKFEKYFEDGYYESLEELSKKATFESETGADIAYKLTLKLNSRISKQIRIMKSLDANVNILRL